MKIHNCPTRRILAPLFWMQPAPESMETQCRQINVTGVWRIQISMNFWWAWDTCVTSPWFVGDHWPGASFGRAWWETWSVEALGQARRLPDTATPFPSAASGNDEDWPGCIPSNYPLLGRFQERDSQWRRCSSFWSSTGRCTAQEKTLFHAWVTPKTLHHASLQIRSAVFAQHR